jgi:SAM-dependent methyltransferase
VTAYDLSQAMLDVVSREAARRGLFNVALRRGAAEALPFADASFDLVATRYSAHHWTDMAAGMKEINRVLRPGGRAVIIDVVSPGPPALDTFLQAVELLRDPSHVRDYSAVEWLTAVANAGLKLERCEMRPLALDFGTWIERMKPPSSHAEAIRSLQALMPQDVAAAFALKPDGSFQVESAMIEAVRPG